MEGPQTAEYTPSQPGADGPFGEIWRNAFDPPPGCVLVQYGFDLLPYVFRQGLFGGTDAASATADDNVAEEGGLLIAFATGSGVADHDGDGVGC
mmetsp:Transcript_18927/g.27213  ORF Transcript_18927/g.27213 Transcript_18927/m.27213 type:complete len:94 (-) Transcript_18927:286-567(-)